MATPWTARTSAAAAAATVTATALTPGEAGLHSVAHDSIGLEMARSSDRRPDGRADGL